MELVIVTGMSGAGKSKAIDTLEDLGWYCVDNLPPKLMSQFAQICAEPDGSINKVAVVVDIRGRDLAQSIEESLREITSMNIKYKTVFLDCRDDTIIRRYKETRRRHPLLDQGCTDIAEALKVEREFLSFARKRADYVIDTTLLSASQLKDKISDIFAEDNKGMMAICMSFGFKYGIPPEADLVFDLRSLPNPYYIEELRPKTGLDKEVDSYVMGFEQSEKMMEKIIDLIDFYVPLADQEGRSQITIAIGCTGGKHRSVTFARRIHGHLEANNVNSALSHRDISKQ